MEIYLYNTITISKEKFEPINPNEVKIRKAVDQQFTAMQYVGNMRALVYIYLQTHFEKNV